MDAACERWATRGCFAVQGVVRLGELRRRRGRLDEAAQLFAQVPGHAFATCDRLVVVPAILNRDARASTGAEQRESRVPRPVLRPRLLSLLLCLAIALPA